MDTLTHLLVWVDLDSQRVTFTCGKDASQFDSSCYWVTESTYTDTPDWVTCEECKSAYGLKLLQEVA